MNRLKDPYLTAWQPYILRDNINLLNIDKQVTIYRLRVQQVPLNSHLKRIGAVTHSCLQGILR